MKLAAIAKLIKADGYCKLYKVFYDDCRTYDFVHWNQNGNLPADRISEGTK